MSAGAWAPCSAQHRQGAPAAAGSEHSCVLLSLPHFMSSLLKRAASAGLPDPSSSRRSRSADPSGSGKRRVHEACQAGTHPSTESVRAAGLTCLCGERVYGKPPRDGVRVCYEQSHRHQVPRCLTGSGVQSPALCSFCKEQDSNAAHALQVWPVLLMCVVALLLVTGRCWAVLQKMLCLQVLAVQSCFLLTRFLRQEKLCCQREQQSAAAGGQPQGRAAPAANAAPAGREGRRLAWPRAQPSRQQQQAAHTGRWELLWPWQPARP